MIIDAHAHIGLRSGQKTVSSLLAEMRRARVDRAAVFAATINGLTTEHLLQEIAPHPKALFGIGTVSPTLKAFQPSLPRVERWLAKGDIRGIKFYTGYEHFYPNDRRLRPYMKLLEKHGRPAIFHMGDTYDAIGGAKLKFAHPLHIDDLASEMPNLKIVIAHLGSPWVIDAAQVCYKNKNVFADCSGFVYGSFNQTQRAHFAELWRKFDLITESSGKILYGSDWPISDMRSYVSVVKKLAGRNAAKVFHGNALGLFGE
jgi:hypothetical protein